VGFDAHLLKEETATVAESPTIGDVGHERHACNFRPTKIGPTQSIPVRGTRAFLLLELVGVDHERNDIVVVDVVLGLREALQGLLGFFEAILANEEPRRFGCKERREGQWYRPDPLFLVSDPNHESTTNADFSNKEGCRMFRTCSAKGILYPHCVGLSTSAFNIRALRN
jgi:hypothetical protein